MHEVWSRIREGQHVAVVGAPPPVPDGPGDEGLTVVQVSCDGPWSTWGPLEDARRRLEALVGGAEEAERIESTMRTSHRLLGDLPEPSPESKLVSAANQLAQQRPGRAALVLEAVDAADQATLKELRDVLERKGWLKLPLVLAVRERPLVGPVAELLACLESEPLIGEASADPAFDWTSLSPELLLVVRAAAVIGRRFEAELVGKLLGMSTAEVLVSLQQVADRGAPLADHGEGRFFLPEAAPATLTQQMLPSLIEHWHHRLGELLAGLSPAEDKQTSPPAPSAPAEPKPQPQPQPQPQPTVSADAAPTAKFAVPVREPPKGDKGKPDGDDDDKGDAGYAELIEPTGEKRLKDLEAEAPAAPEVPSTPAEDKGSDQTGNDGEGDEEDEEERAPDPSATMRLSHDDARRLIEQGAAASRARDQARAAHHLSAAGRPEAAVEQYLAALRRVAARGDSRRALLIADQALSVLDRQPPSRALDLLHARVLATAARVQWRGAGRGPELTLQGALETVDEAESLVGKDGPLDLRTEIAQLVAGVCYDLGDISSLQRALQALAGASRSLMAAGEATKAARLLNDQAAVYLRAGDPVRANHLLQQSRKIFDALYRDRPDDPTVIIERAETEHLLARLPLHARLRPGREADGYSMALGHARASEEAYRRVGARVEIGRVWETMGRLETARKRFGRAGDRLNAALELQRQLGDVGGLARSTAALAELYIAAERPAKALGALRDSVAFNLDKGSPLGMAVNRRTVDRLKQVLALDPRSTPALVQAVQEVDQEIDAAETMLGRISVPGD